MKTLVYRNCLAHLYHIMDNINQSINQSISTYLVPVYTSPGRRGITNVVGTPAVDV